MSVHDQYLLDLVRKAKRQDDAAFQKVLKELDADLKKLATRYFISGSDFEDVLQQCRLGVWKAVHDFDEDGGMSFRNFAVALCCRRQVITAMASANRKKNDLLNKAVSLDEPVCTTDDEGSQTLADFIQDKSMPLLERLMSEEELRESYERLDDKLTDLEKKILHEYSYDESYKGIASKLNIKTKAVDNGILRVRRKSAEIYTNYQQELVDLEDDDLCR